MTFWQNLFSHKNKINTVVICVLACLALSGCANPFKGGKDSISVVLTTGFAEDEVFRIEDISCSLAEVELYLVNTQNSYQSTLGGSIWDADPGLTESLKTSCLARLAQIKTMVLLAQHNGIMLDDSEKKAAQNAAKEYYESLSEADIKAMDNVTCDTIQTLYEEQALAGKLYEYTIRDINPEVSDDEARTLTVQQILLKTYETDDSGNRTEMSTDSKAKVYSKMKEIQAQLDEGASFESMVETYNEAEEGTVSFGKGEVDVNLETVAFNLSTDQISDIIETEDGYMLIKCVTTFDKEETELNKVRIAEERRSQAFAEEYDEFAKGLTREINSQLWDSITLCDDPEVTTNDFFDIYSKYFED